VERISPGGDGRGWAGGEEQAELGQPGHQQLRPGQRGKGQQQPQQSNRDGADDSERGGCEAGGAAINARAGFTAAGKKQLVGRGGEPMSQPDKPIMRRAEGWWHDLAGLGRLSGCGRAK
jgi:hypothetical protein